MEGVPHDNLYSGYYSSTLHSAAYVSAKLYCNNAVVVERPLFPGFTVALGDFCFHLSKTLDFSPILCYTIGQSNHRVHNDKETNFRSWTATIPGTVFPDTGIG